MKRSQGQDAGDAAAAVEDVIVKPLGAGQEVGRSCYVVKYQGKAVMFDCGIHPAHQGMASLPLLDSEDLAQIDVALITHFHLDHCGAVPYLVGSTAFKGQIFMTHATKSIFYTMMKDALRMHKGNPQRQLFTGADLEKAMHRISVINFHQTVEADGVRITPYRAGHVLGAAMFMIEIKGMRCLYTGDYSRQPDRHMPAADLPGTQPHIVIVESTFGTSNHLPREARERSFQSKVREIVGRGGRCLIPVVALGRAQELLLILEDCWKRHPELHGIPIHQTSGTATQSLGVYQSYIEMMNEDIRAAFKQRNPFDFRFVRHTRGFRADTEIGPAVVLATPSMLQTGLSRELFEAWCEDSDNGVIIADFAVQGTLASDVLTTPREVLSADGRSLKLRCSIASFSFSAHADYSQTSEFITKLAPPHVVLCHGNQYEMEKLKTALAKNAAAQGAERTIHTPKNASEVSIPCAPKRTVFVVGELATRPPKRGARVQGILVQRSQYGDPCVMEPKDLGLYNKVSTARLVQRQVMALQVPFEKCRLALELMFDGIDATQSLGGIDCIEADAKGGTELHIADQVAVTHVPAQALEPAEEHGQVVLQWESSPHADCIADAVVAVLLQEQGAPSAIGVAEAERKRAMAQGDDTAVQNAERSMAVELLKAQFGNAIFDEASETIRIEIPGNKVSVDWENDKVACEPEDEPLRDRVVTCMERMRAALEKIRPQDLSSGGEAHTAL